MQEDRRRAKELEKEAKAARKEEKRKRKQAEQEQMATAAAAQGGDAALPAYGGRHGPSELPYPAAAGDAGIAGDEEGDERQLSWLLGQLLQ